MIPSHREPTHPGEVLLEEFLKPHGLKQVKAAALMGIPLNRLNEIIRGRRSVTADSALRLAKLLRTSPEFWMNLQAMWDIYRAAKDLDLNLGAVFAEPKTSPSRTGSREVRIPASGWTATTEARIVAAPIEEPLEKPAAANSRLGLAA